MKQKYNNRHIVDKTEYISKIIKNGSMLFCARPRTFGKTLVVDMMDDIFQGKREKFKGFFIDKSDYNWKKYPVIHIDFTGCSEKTASGLASWINFALNDIAEDYGIPFSLKESYDDNILMLIETLGKKNGVVILVDEYNREVFNNLNNPEVVAMQEVLQGFFDIIKAMGNYIRFCFITGVTQFPITSAFSGMNNLTDLTYLKNYACMYGYTQKELEENFADEIEHGIKATGMERAAYLQKVKDWYGGYCFAPGAEQVYNAFSINTFFDSREGEHFVSNWTQAENMQLLVDVAKMVDFNIIKDLPTPITKYNLNNFDILNIAKRQIGVPSLKVLLLQTGYLTIKSIDEDGYIYLDFPNIEVRTVFSERFLSSFASHY